MGFFALLFIYRFADNRPKRYFFSKILMTFFSSGTWNRTKIHGFKGRCPTIRRSPNDKRAEARLITCLYCKAAW